MMVNVESICETKVTINDDNVGGWWAKVEGYMEWYEFFAIHTNSTNTFEWHWRRNFVDQKASTKLCLEGTISIMFLGHDGT